MMRPSHSVSAWEMLQVKAAPFLDTFSRLVALVTGLVAARDFKPKAGFVMEAEEYTDLLRLLGHLETNFSGYSYQYRWRACVGSERE